MTMQTLKITVEGPEYQRIRWGSMRGQLNAIEHFELDQKLGLLTVVTEAPKMLKEQLAIVLDLHPSRVDARLTEKV